MTTAKPNRRVAIVACSGIGKTFGTVSREAAYDLTEDLRPQQTELVALAMLVLGDESARAAVAQNPVTEMNAMWGLSDLQSWTTWELRGNRWVELTNAPTTAPTPQPVLDQAQRMIEAGNGKAGARTAVEWLRDRPRDTPQRDRALMLVAEGYFLDGKRMDAFYYLDELMDEHPESPLYARALQRQFDIADAYLNGYKRVFLWFPTLGAQDEAMDMLFRIQQRSPGSQMAEKALLRAADHYYKTSEFDIAADAYMSYLRSYPRSPLVPRIRLRRAYATLAQFHGTRYDATPLVDARSQLSEIASAYPEIADEEGLLDLVRRIDDTFAKKVYRTADFYRRTRQPVAAVYNYRFLIATFPGTPEAKLAAERLKEFPASVLANRAPRPSDSYLPSTQPIYPEMPEVP